MDKTFISRHIIDKHWYNCPHRFTRASKPFDCCLSHFLTSVSTSSSSSAKYLPPRCGPPYARNTSHHEQETFLCTEYLWPHKNTQQNAALRQYTPQARSPFWLLKPASECAIARLLPSDTQRNPITFITVGFLPFVTYLLTLHRFMCLWPVWGAGVQPRTFPSWTLMPVNKEESNHEFEALVPLPGSGVVGGSGVVCGYLYAGVVLVVLVLAVVLRTDLSCWRLVEGRFLWVWGPPWGPCRTLPFPELLLLLLDGCFGRVLLWPRVGVTDTTSFDVLKT
jgi:hypothetical protein